MYVFDVLIFNPLRAQQFMLYSPDNWQLVLTGHNKSFDTGRSRPRYLKEIELSIGVGWQEKLADLTDDVLNDALADVMNSRRIKALARRRDLLLEDATK